MLAEQGTLHEYLRDSCWNYPAFLFSSTPIRQFVRKFPAVSENSRAVLAWRGEGIRRSGEGDANKGGVRPAVLV